MTSVETFVLSFFVRRLDGLLIKFGGNAAVLTPAGAHRHHIFGPVTRELRTEKFRLERSVVGPERYHRALRQRLMGDEVII